MGLPRVLPNQVVKPKRERRTYVADEIDECRDISGLYLRRPFEKVVRACIGWGRAG